MKLAPISALLGVIKLGNSGIGLATATRLERRSFVLIAARWQTELDKRVSVIGKSVTGITKDLSRPEGVGHIAAAFKIGMFRLHS